MIRNRTVATASCFVSMSFLGIGVAIVGAAARNIGIAPSEIGFLITAQNVGFGLSVLIAGRLADTLPKSRLMAVGSVVVALAFATFYLWEPYAVNVLIMAAMGAGMGIYEGVTDALLLDLHEKRGSRYITINHFFVSIGSVTITLYLIYLQMNWRASLVQIAAVVAAMAVLFLFLRTPGKRSATPPVREMLRAFAAEGAIAVLFVAGVCAIGLGAGTIGLVTSFLTELRGFDQVTSKVGLVLFLAGLAGGRLLVGFLAKQGSVFRRLLAFFILAGTTLTVLYLVPVPSWMLYVLCLAAGLSVAPLLPLVIAGAGMRYREAAGSAMGVVKLAIPAGGIVVPAILGAVAAAVSFTASLVLFPVVAGVAVITLLLGRSGLQGLEQGGPSEDRGRRLRE